MADPADCHIAATYAMITAESLGLGSEIGVIEKQGAWFSFGPVRLGQGRENTKMFLKENPDILREVEQGIRAKKGLHLGACAASAGSAADAEAAVAEYEPAAKPAEKVKESSAKGGKK